MCVCVRPLSGRPLLSSSGNPVHQQDVLCLFVLRRVGGGQLQFISGDLTSCQDSGSLPPNAVSNHVLKMISIYQSAHPSIHPVLVSGQVMFCTSSWGSRLSKASLDPSRGALISSQEKRLIEGNL